jgi:hypothetical protein
MRKQMRIWITQCFNHRMIPTLLYKHGIRLFSEWGAMVDGETLYKWRILRRVAEPACGWEVGYRSGADLLRLVRVRSVPHADMHCSLAALPPDQRSYTLAEIGRCPTLRISRRAADVRTQVKSGRCWSAAEDRL